MREIINAHFFKFDTIYGGFRFDIGYAGVLTILIFGCIAHKIYSYIVRRRGRGVQ